MAMKYSAILCTLCGMGENKVNEADVWQNPQSVLETLAEAGYDGVDVDAEPDRIDAKKFNEVVEIAFSLGLKVPALIGAWALWHAGEPRDLASPDPEARKLGVRYAKKAIDLAANFEDPPIFEIVPCPVENDYPQTQVPIDLLMLNFVETTREIVDYAGERGVRIAIEPVNRFEAYAGFMNTVDEVMSIVDQVDSPWLGVLADCFHINIEDTSVNDALLRAGDRLMHIHLADSTRAAPGTGHIDFKEMLRTLNGIGFDGYLSYDCVPPRPDWKTSVTHTIGYMKGIEKTMGLLD